MKTLPDCYRCHSQPCVCKDGITLYHADCRDVLPLLEPGSVDLVLTDPPFGNGTDYVSFDDSPDNAVAIGLEALRLSRQLSKLVAITPGISLMWKYPEPSWVCAWFNPAGERSGKWGFSTWAPVLVYGNDPYLASGKGRHPDSFWKRPKITKKNGHPCPKALDVWKPIVLRLSAGDADVVCDPLAGSGTTGRACKDLGRKCIMVEIEEKYCRIAANRLKQEVLF